MRTLRCLVPCLLLSVASAVFAENGPWGLGLVIGEPTGVSAAYRLDKDHEIQGLLAWKLTSPGGVTAAADYLFLFSDLVKIDGITVPVYAGVGAKTMILTGDDRFSGSDSAFALGLRLPVGVRWEFKEVPLEAFLEIVPGMLLLPGTYFDIGAGIGVRWYF